MNFVPVRLTDKSGDQATLWLPDGQSVQLRANVSQLENNTELVLGLRPQNIGTGSGQTFAMQIEVVEQLGASTLAYGNCFGQSNFVAELPGSSLGVGEKLTLSFDPTQAMLFGPDGLSSLG